VKTPPKNPATDSETASPLLDELLSLSKEDADAMRDILTKMSRREEKENR
jgi:hypothetical protein